MFLYTKKKMISVVILSGIFTGCGSANSTNSSSATSLVLSESTVASKAIQTGQVKDFNTGKGLEKVTVSLGNATTTTDSNGFYTFSNLTPTKEAVVTFRKKGYLIGSTKTEIKSFSADNILSPNYVEYGLYANDYTYRTEKNIDSSRIFTDTSTLVDSKGDTYSGAAFVNLSIIDIREKAFLSTFPGAFKGITTEGNVVPFTSYGLINIKIRDAKGDTLHLSDNDTATLVFYAPSTEKEETMPLWYYNQDKGLWIEDGYAQRQSNGTYKGEVTHLGTWSLNKPVDEDMGIYTDRIVYPDGTPVKNLRVYAIGKNWKSTDLTTDENGVFQLEVAPGEAFGLQVYHYTDKYTAKYNGSIPAIIAGETVNKIQ